jgi:DNA-binding transcriptional LysR family regulator
MPNPLDLYQLRALHAFSRTGSFAAAAQALHVTPSAISHAVRKLEASVEVPLVNRRGAKATLTEEGFRLCQACETVFTLLDDTAEDLRRADARVTGRLRLGAPVEFGSTVLMKHIRPFLEAHPGLAIDFTLGDQLLEPLLRDDLDLAIDCHAHAARELKRPPCSGRPMPWSAPPPSGTATGWRPPGTWTPAPCSPATAWAPGGTASSSRSPRRPGPSSPGSWP